MRKQANIGPFIVSTSFYLESNIFNESGSIENLNQSILPDNETTGITKSISNLENTGYQIDSRNIENENGIFWQNIRR